MTKFLTKFVFIFTIILIIFVSFYLRIFDAERLLSYSHDYDLAGWIVKDIVFDKHFRLIGQETSTQGIFIGGLYYYLQIPFYLMFNMDPYGVVFLASLLGVFTTISYFYVFNKIFNKFIALVASLIHAVSLFIVFTEREVVPTAPVFLWSVWFLYTVHLFLINEQLKAFILSAVLGALIWHINFALILPFSLLFIVLFFFIKKVNIKFLLLGLLFFIVLNTPLIVFEIRHNFIQTKALITSLTTNQMDVYHGIGKFIRVFHLMGKNLNDLVFGGATNIKYDLFSLIPLVVLLMMIYRKVIRRDLGIIFLSWILLYVAFFSTYSKIVSEYYLNGVIVVYIAVISILVGNLLERRKTRIIGIIFLIVFCYFNYKNLVNYPFNRSGYYERKNLVKEIRRNAIMNGYPCVSVSYITKPGYNLGYRYLFWWLGMHVNRPESNSPVYTIVFPLRDDIKVDKTFGSLGLIYPDYSRYTKEEVTESCSGENSNLTDPMFGFTK